jgi:hypothetical protein
VNRATVSATVRGLALVTTPSPGPAAAGLIAASSPLVVHAPRA